jgi:ribosomal protein S18 acetylase RimI-like enzyme
MQLLQAQTNHIPHLLPLVTQFYTHFNYSFDAQKHQNIIAQFLSNPHYGIIYLIVDEGEYVGYIALTYGFTFEFGGRDAFIDEFYIAEKYRSRGLGKWVMHEIIQKMPDLGLCALHLQTEAYNERAKKLYIATGFTDYKRSTLTYLWKI